MSAGPARRLAGAVCCAVVVAICGSAPAAPAAADPPRPDARAWILVDAGDGEVLAAHRARRPAAIASTTKLMTAYVARRRLGLDERVVAPGYDGDPVESLLGLRAGERIRVRDLLAGLLLVSGNDAAVALAEASSGSVGDFVAAMNGAAERLGLAGTSYENPIGLDAPDNHSTPYDLARLAIELRRDPFLRDLFDTPRMRLMSGAQRRSLVNRNDLVLEVPWVDGVKTGQTSNAGHVLVASGTRKGVTLVSVVLGADDEDARDEATLALLRYGFSLYHRTSPVTRSERLAAAAIRYRDERLPLLAGGVVRLTLREGQEVDTRVVAPDEVEGPISRRERLGRATVTVDGDVVARVPVVAGRSVAAPTALERIDAAIPGSRPVAWGLAIGLVAVAVAGILGVRGSRRRGRRGG